MFILDGSQEEHETKADRESGVALQVSASIITDFFCSVLEYSIPLHYRNKANNTSTDLQSNT